MQKLGGTTEDMKKTSAENIALSELFPFKNHPFRVPDADDTEMKRLIESIREKGVITPGIARPMPDGSGYEIIAGHRRKMACEMLGLKTMPVIVKDCDDDEAILLMVTSNVQRKGTRKSEEIKAYSLMYAAMKHQGKIDEKDRKGSKSTRETIGKIAGVSGMAIRRYVELSRLSDDFLEMLDNKRLKPSIGVVISSLPENDQRMIQDFLVKNSSSRISFNQANELKKLSKAGTLSPWKVEESLKREGTRTPKIVRISFSQEEQEKYFAGVTDPEQIKNKVLSALEGHSGE